MQPVQLIDLAAQQARWLAVRQTAVAGNIANVNTPGYSAVEVEPFERVLDNTRVAMAATQPGHIANDTSSGPLAVRENGDPALMPSGNTVVLEQELMKAGEVRRGLELNTAIVKAFHRMILMTVRT